MYLVPTFTRIWTNPVFPHTYIYINTYSVYEQWTCMYLNVRMPYMCVCVCEHVNLLTAGTALTKHNVNGAECETTKAWNVASYYRYSRHMGAGMSPQITLHNRKCPVLHIHTYIGIQKEIIQSLDISSLCFKVYVLRFLWNSTKISIFILLTLYYYNWIQIY